MYRGFNIKGIELEDKRLYDLGNAQSVKHNAAIAHKIDSFILRNGKIDGTKMQSNWFPTIDADIFLSHSHKDLVLAKTFAGWLKDKFDISTFIDSCVWGYSDNLLKQIDNDHCRTGDNLYSYDSRNFSTSHVHMMLASALTMMMDKAEVLFFLNTPQSLSTDDIKHKTMSPWIYFELTTSRFIRKPIPDRLVPKVLNDGYSMVKTANLDIEYTVDFCEFIELRADQINEWAAKASTDDENSLDSLYKLHPLD